MTTPNARIAVVTGSSRGLGAALSRALCAAGWTVHGVSRTLARPDGVGDNFVGHAIDLRQLGWQPELALCIPERIDLLVNNAAILADSSANPERSRGPIPRLMMQSVETVFRVNLLAPILVIQSCLMRLAPGAVVLNITSKPAVGANQTGTLYAYGPSKAALTRWTWEAASELATKGVTMVAVYPGWLRTEMGGPSGEVEADEAARDLLALGGSLTVKDAGRYMDRFGRDCAASR